MSPRFVALIRHGAYAQRKDTPSALQPYPLTADGLAQATECGQTLAALLDAEGWALDPVAHCSRQLRAWQTATQALEHLDRAGHPARLEQNAALSERAVGSAANLTLSEIEDIVAADPRFAPLPAGWKSDSHFCLPLQGAESLMMAGARVADYLHATMAAQTPPQQPSLTLFFGHGAAFRHAAHHLGLLDIQEIPKISMYHARPLLLCYKGEGEWQHYGGSWKPRGTTDPLTD